MTYRYNARVSGQSREELDKDGLDQARKFFGIDEVTLETADVTWASSTTVTGDTQGPAFGVNEPAAKTSQWGPSGPATL